MTIVRARPNLDVNKLLSFKSKVRENTTSEIDQCNSSMYFNSASAALKAYLEYLVDISENNQLRVGVQVFTCETVFNAIEESGNEVILFDVSKHQETPTTRFYDFVERYKSVDVFILTHLFGVVNSDISVYSEFCKENNIILINDFAQIDVRCLSDEFQNSTYITSFSFDKPMAVGFGGKIHVKDDVFFEQCCSKYKELEDNSITYNINRTILYYKLTSPYIYKGEFRFNTILEKIIINLLNIKLIRGISDDLIFSLLSSFINKLLRKLEGKIRYNNKIKIRRIKQKHVPLFLNCASVNEYLLNDYQEYFVSHEFSHNCVVRTQRIIVDRCNLSDSKFEGIEIDLYNFKNSRIEEKLYPNSYYIMTNMTNMPLWNKYD